MDGLIFVLLLIAIGLGYVVGRFWRWDTVGGNKKSNEQFERQYLLTFNHLLKDRSDLAIEHFIDNLEVNDQTLETHLSYGIMLRRKGEVDRAIRIHQNLLSRPSLRALQLDQVHFELGKDYHQSGLLDRAEALFTQVAASSSLEIKQKCFKALTDIYWIEQEWEKAISSAEMLCSRRIKKGESEKWRRLQAFFCCELADQAEHNKDRAAKIKWVDQALLYDKSALRAHALKFELEIRAGNVKVAYKSLCVLRQSALVMPILIPLVESYFKNGDAKQKYQFLFDLYQLHGTEQLLLPLGDEMANLQGAEVAANFVAHELESYESLKPLATISDLVERQIIPYSLLKPMVMGALPPLFRCGQCGFESSQFYWSCPTCKTLVE